MRLIDEADVIHILNESPVWTALDAIDRVRGIRPIEMKKVGHWNWSLSWNGWADHTCSECGYVENTDVHVSLGWNYCPNCGAYMRGEKRYG